MQSYRWHAALQAGMAGPVVAERPVHLQQSDLDGACGTHCALMALMAFGIVNRDDLDHLPRARQKRLNAFWQRGERHYFRGLQAEQLQAIFQPYAKDLSCAIARTDCIPQVLAVLQADGLGILHLHHPDFDHWVLAVGSGGPEHPIYHPDALLILDPSHGALPLTPWNGLLSLKQDRLQRQRYSTPEGTVRVSLACVVTLRRQSHARH